MFSMKLFLILLLEVGSDVSIDRFNRYYGIIDETFDAGLIFFLS